MFGLLRSLLLTIFVCIDFINNLAIVYSASDSVVVPGPAVVAHLPAVTRVTRHGLVTPSPSPVSKVVKPRSLADTPSVDSTMCKCRHTNLVS